MRVIWGASWSHFLRFFDSCSFSWNFSHFSMKHIKNEKMKKCLPIRKLRCFMRVARLKKNREALKIHDKKNLDFPLKIDPISSQKSEPNQICYKNYSKCATQGTLAVHGLIFAPFWDPKGIPKSWKMDEGLWQKSLEISPGASLGSFWAPDCCFLWFRLIFAFILGPSGLDFGSTVEDLLTFSTSKPMKQQDSKTAKQQQERKKTRQQPKNPTSQQPNDLARRNARSA